MTHVHVPEEVIWDLICFYLIPYILLHVTLNWISHTAPQLTTKILYWLWNYLKMICLAIKFKCRRTAIEKNIKLQVVSQEFLNKYK
jgi:hypothetical protein